MMLVAMTPKKAKQAMTPEAMQGIMAKSGLKPADFAKVLDVHRATVYRWLAGSVNIDAASAALIRAKFKTK